jgi:hypothetical protein
MVQRRLIRDIGGHFRSALCLSINDYVVEVTDLTQNNELTG